MYRYRTVLVPIGFTPADVSVVRYAGLVSRMARSERVRFLHAARQHDLSEWLHGRFPELAEGSAGELEERLRGLVAREFDGGPTPQVEYAIVEGSCTTAVLRQLREDDADLVVVGRRRDRREAGGVAERLARKAPCSVLVVPEGAEPRLASILVGIDFADSSRDALDVAAAFAAAAEAGAPRVYGLHVYQVPAGFHKTGKTYEEFARIIKGHAETRYAEFIGAADLRGVEVEPVFLLDPRPAGGIQSAAEVLAADLIVTGARGRGAGAGVLLGSVTENLIATSDVPVLAAKKKGEGMSLLEALLKL